MWFGDITISPSIIIGTHTQKTYRAMKDMHAVKQIAFGGIQAVPGDKLYVLVAKLNEYEVLTPSLLVLHSDIDLESGRQLIGWS